MRGARNGGGALAPTAAAPAGLLRVEEARIILAECKRVDEAKSIRDKAEAIRIYLRNQKASAEAQNDAAEIKLRAERRLGELLHEQKERGERDAGRGGDRKSRSHGATVNDSPPNLRDLEITKSQASRWQQVAAIEEAQFEAHVQGLRRAGERITTAALTQELKRTEKLDAIAEQARIAPALEAVRPCPVVYADPPWEYENTASAGAAVDQYPTMPIEEICALTPPATEDAILFLWATSPLLERAMEVIRAWGFAYKGSMVWDKRESGGGIGSWVANRHELLLIATRGKIPPPSPDRRPPSIISAPRGVHSAKPDVFAEAIETMYPTLPRVEMFARRKRDGWIVWGNQAA